ncbi:MAG TPA: class I SAM-dependent methyltransferase [Candidatus Angelobacter sp.]|nr:class I SAM-dependent methyltransferase [Candidatus Angelobacter sp.]
MDAALAPVADAAIALAAVRSGERVLDIGCGSGGTSISLARLVGPTGHVTGLDVSRPMIELARKRSVGMANLDWLLADAASHDFPPRSADLLFSRFGVMFFGEPVMAFANLRRALRPGGRLVFACWRPLNENPWMLLPLQVVQSLVPPMPRPGPNDPGPFAFDDPERVTRILTTAGFASPRYVRFEIAMVLGTSLDDAAEQATSMGAASRALQGQPEAVIEVARTAVRAALVPYLEFGRVALPGAIWLVESSTAQ